MWPIFPAACLWTMKLVKCLLFLLLSSSLLLLTTVSLKASYHIQDLLCCTDTEQKTCSLTAHSSTLQKHSHGSHMHLFVHWSFLPYQPSPSIFSCSFKGFCHQQTACQFPVLILSLSWGEEEWQQPPSQRPQGWAFPLPCSLWPLSCSIFWHHRTCACNTPSLFTI